MRFTKGKRVLSRKDPSSRWTSRNTVILAQTCQTSVRLNFDFATICRFVLDHARTRYAMRNRRKSSTDPCRCTAPSEEPAPVAHCLPLIEYGKYIIPAAVKYLFFPSDNRITAALLIATNDDKIQTLPANESNRSHSATRNAHIARVDGG